MSSDVYQTIEVPDDWADAIESMKLAIVRHKAANWPEISSKDASAILVWLAMLAVRDDLSVNQTENNPGKNTELANETIVTLRARIAELEAEVNHLLDGNTILLNANTSQAARILELETAIAIAQL